MSAGASLVQLYTALVYGGPGLPRRIVRFASDRVWMRRISLRFLYVHPEKVPPEVAYGDALNLRSSPGFWPHMLRGPWLRYVDGVDSDERPRVPTRAAVRP